MFDDNESYAGDDWAWQLKLSYEQRLLIGILSDRVLIRLLASFVTFYSNNNQHTLYLYGIFPAAEVLSKSLFDLRLQLALRLWRSWLFFLIKSTDFVCMCVVLHPGGPAAFSPGNLSTSSSASSTLGSPDNDEYILSFETIDKMRRVSSYSSLNSLIGNSLLAAPQLCWAITCFFYCCS